jgi:TonB family protein
MQPGVRNPRSSLSFEAIPPVKSQLWRLPELEYPELESPDRESPDRESPAECATSARRLESPDVTVPATAFACLAEPPGRWNAFAISLLGQAALLLVLANATFFLVAPTLNQLDTRSIVHLVAPDLLQAPTDLIPKAMDAPVKQVAKPTRPALETPQVTPPLILPSKLPLDAEKAVPPDVRKTLAFRGSDAAAAPLISRAIVSTKFAGDVAPAAEGKPARQVQTGGFGDRDGVQAGDGNNGKGPVLAKVGAFDMPSGPGSGNGTGGAKGIRSNSTSASFGNASAGPVDSRATAGQGTVRPVNFSSGVALISQAPKHEAVSGAPAKETPVLLLSKPLLAYTPEARQKKIEGDVELDVLFAATGQVSVLRVVQGLGYGLDEAAVSAAERIRFTPARREGQPVDSHGLLRMVFRLS